MELHSELIYRVFLFIRILTFVTVFVFVSWQVRGPILMLIALPLIPYYVSLCFGMRWGWISGGFIVTILEIIVRLKRNGEVHPFSLLYSFAGFLLKAIQVSLFQLMASFIINHQKLIKQNQDLMNDLREYASQSASLAAAEERTRMMRDIHDSLGHSLTALTIQINKAIAYLPRNREETESALTEASLLASESIQAVRESLNSLKRNKRFDFLSETEKIISRIDRDSYQVNYRVQGSPEGFSYTVLTALYRTVQEGVTNILKHSRADCIDIGLDFREEDCLLNLKDNGIGFTFDPGQLSGHGLEGLRQRLELVRGLFEVITEPGKGTVLKVRVPKDPSHLIYQGVL